MSNTSESRYSAPIPGGLGIQRPEPANHQPEPVPGEERIINSEWELPGGRVATVRTRINATPNDAKQIREQHQRETYLKSSPDSFTAPIKRELADLTAKWDSVEGYDRNGEPILTVQGHERRKLEMAIASRRNALHLAERDAAIAAQMQAEAKQADAERLQRIEAKAKERAAELAEDAEIERRARQIAASKHGLK